MKLTTESGMSATGEVNPLTYVAGSLFHNLISRNRKRPIADCDKSRRAEERRWQQTVYRWNNCSWKIFADSVYLWSCGMKAAV